MKLIILDRDGVINHDSDDYIKTVDEWQPIAGSLQAIGRLSQSGYTVAVATNQSGISRGYYDIETMHGMHKKMSRMLEQYGGQVEVVVFCPHGPNDNCDCRKPKPGMLLEIASRYQCELADVLFVGDTISDIKAAKAAGATPVLVRTGKGERTIASAEFEEMKDITVYEDLAEAVQVILSEK